MNKKNPIRHLLNMLTVFVGASILFLMGFFPASQHLIDQHDENRYKLYKPTQLDDFTLNIPKAKYEQVILMLIDAWRFDFANETHMPFALKAVCHPLSIIVDIPTVTMPRLKSLTSGTISNFVDVILNLGHTHHLKDSLLHRLNAKNKTAVFAGDDTWIRLFPNSFRRSQANTDSFFVNDFYKGDTNVTNTLKKELLLKDWHFLVLHYLGLDHIGHVEGSNSAKIFKKLLEMDGVIEYIVKNESFQNQLLLVTGDHGMRNGGGHGGSNIEEMYVPLMLFEQKCSNNNNSVTKSLPYKQIDLAPSLAVLLDTDIPKTSLGNLIPELIQHYTPEEQLYFYYYNTRHLFAKMFAKYSRKHIFKQDYFKWYLEAKKAHRKLLLKKTPLSYYKAKHNYIRLCKKLSELLTNSLVKFEYDIIVIGLILTTLSALEILLHTLFENSYTHSIRTQLHQQTNLVQMNTFFKCYIPSIIINYAAHTMQWIQYRSILYAFLLNIPITLNVYLSINIFKLVIQILLPLNRKFRPHFKLTIPPLLSILFVYHMFSLISTSFIEEEHQTWYYLTPTLFIYLTIQNFYQNIKELWKREGLTGGLYDDNNMPISFNTVLGMLYQQLWKIRNCFVAMFALIFSRRLNQSGNKWHHLVDLGDILNKQKNAEYLHLLLLIALLLLWCILKKYNSPDQMYTCTLALMSVFCYRQSPEKHGVTLVVFWFSVLLTFLLQYREYLHRYFGWIFNCTINGSSCFSLLQVLKTNFSCFLIVCALLHEPHNVVLLPVMIFILETAYHLCDDLHLSDMHSYNRCYTLIMKAGLTIFVGNMFYFFQGNTNSLSSINLNPGYIGQKSYNPVITAILITLNMYCAQISALLCLMCHMFDTKVQHLPVRQEKEQFTNTQLLEFSEEDLYLVLNVLTTSIVTPAALYWCILVKFRYHLFIYSVFAPKAIFKCFHLLVFYFNFVLTTLYVKILNES